MFCLQALASVLSVAAQMKEAMVDLEEGSARSQVCLSCFSLFFIVVVFSFVFVFFFGMDCVAFLLCV